MLRVKRSIANSYSIERCDTIISEYSDTISWTNTWRECDSTIEFVQMRRQIDPSTVRRIHITHSHSRFKAPIHSHHLVPSVFCTISFGFLQLSNGHRVLKVNRRWKFDRATEAILSWCYCFFIRHFYSFVHFQFCSRSGENHDEMTEIRKKIKNAHATESHELRQNIAYDSKVTARSENNNNRPDDYRRTADGDKPARKNRPKDRVETEGSQRTASDSKSIRRVNVYPPEF